MSRPGRQACGIATIRRHFAVARTPQFARWILRYSGPAPAVAMGPWRFVYRYSLPGGRNLTLRMMLPLHLAQITQAFISRSEHRWAFPVIRDVPAAPQAVSQTTTNVLHMRFAPLNCGVREALPKAMPMRGASPIVPGLRVSESRFHYLGTARSTFALRAERFESSETAMRYLSFPAAAPTRFETHAKQRADASPEPQAPASLATAATAGAAAFTPNIFAALLRPGMSATARSFFSSRSTTSLTFLKNHYIGGTAVFLPGSSHFETTPAERVPVPVAPAIANPTTASPHQAASHAFAIRLPGTRTVREIQLATGMVLSTRPEQVLSATNTTYVFAQQPRPAAVEPPRSFGDRQEIVHLVHHEIRNAMSSGTVVSHFTRHDFASIAEKVESLLKRRLVVEKERLGFPG